MMRQSEYKKRFDPELGRYTRQHIYGEGITDIFKSVGSKLFGKTMKKAAKNPKIPSKKTPYGKGDSAVKILKTLRKFF